MTKLTNRVINGNTITCTYDSSNIVETKYDVPTMILEVTFKNGLQYKYHAVTAMEHAGMQIAESAGKYFNKAIRVKRYEKISVHDQKKTKTKKQPPIL